MSNFNTIKTKEFSQIQIATEKNRQT